MYALLRMQNGEITGWLIGRWDEVVKMFNDMKWADNDLKDFQLPEYPPEGSKVHLSDRLLLLYHRKTLD